MTPYGLGYSSFNTHSDGHCAITVNTNVDIITSPAPWSAHFTGGFTLLGPRTIVFYSSTPVYDMVDWGGVWVNLDSNPGKFPFAYPIYWMHCATGVVSVAEQTAFVDLDSEDATAFLQAAENAAASQQPALDAISSLRNTWEAIRAYEAQPTK